MDKLRQAAWTAIHKINRSTGFDEESDNLLMEAASVLREALDHSGETNKMVAEQADQEHDGHWSDCSMHNEPAYPNGPCDCGGYPPKHWRCACGANLYIDSNGAPASKAEREAWSHNDMAYRPGGLSMDQEQESNTQLMEGYRIGLAEMREKCATVSEQGTGEAVQKAALEILINERKRIASAIRAIKFEGDTGFRPVSEMIAEHKQDPKKAAAIEKAKMRKASRAEKIAMPSVYEEALEHITDGSPCWCNPEMTYKDPINGAEVWVHKEL